MRSFLYGQGDLIFAAATIDRDPSVKDEMGNRSDACCSRSGRLLLNAFALSRIKSDRASLSAIEPVICGDSGKHISVRYILRTEEIGFGDGHRERMLRTPFVRGENKRVGRLRGIGPELATEIEGQSRGVCLGFSS